MNLDKPTTKVPLRTDKQGIVRVEKTRVTLETLVFAFKNGASCEEIVLQYPVLDLGDVYTIIAFYLKHREAVDAYFLAQQKPADELKQNVQKLFPTNIIRQKLLVRQSELMPV